MEAIGCVSGAALGFILGDIPGAVYGCSLGAAAARARRSAITEDEPEKTLPKMPAISKTRKANEVHSRNKYWKRTGRMKASAVKNKMKRRAKASRASIAKKKAGKPAFKLAGSSATKKTKKAATNFVESVVQRVLNANEVIGTYRKTYTMDQAPFNVTTGYQQYIVGGQRSGANAGDYTQKALRFTPCSIEKIADAAACLWNAKIRNIDYSVEADNFTTGDHQIKCEYAAYHLGVRNVTNVAFHVTVYEVTNKVNESGKSFFEVFSDLLADNNLEPTPTVNGGLVNQYGVTPQTLKFTDAREIPARYSIKRIRSAWMRPGDMMHIDYVIKDKLIDLREFAQSDTLLFDYCKGDRQLIFKCVPREHGVYSSTTAFTGTLGVPSATYSGLSFLCREVYKISTVPTDLAAGVTNGEKVMIFEDIPNVVTGETVTYRDIPEWKREGTYDFFGPFA